MGTWYLIGDVPVEFDGSGLDLFDLPEWGVWVIVGLTLVFDAWCIWKLVHP